MISESQTLNQQALTSSKKDHVQDSAQMEKKGENQVQKLPSDLAEIVTAWPDLPDYIKAAVNALVKTAG